MKSLPVIFFLTVVIFFSCGKKTKTTEKNVSMSDMVQPIVPETKLIYGIQGKDIPIRYGPGIEYDIRINEKSTAALQRIDYTTIDESVKVEVYEIRGGWSFIDVIDPDWLRLTHFGWIPTKHLVKLETTNSSEDLKNLDPTDYEILKTEHSSKVQNFHILIKQTVFNKESVFQFIKRFRKEYCTMNCNVLVYDSKSVLPLLGIYLEGGNYINYADHLVAMSTFDAAEVKSWYPFQDNAYKEYGGKNWKKEPVK